MISHVDIYDHYFASIDSQIHYAEKFGRLLEIFNIFACVGSWTTYCEIKYSHKYNYDVKACQRAILEDKSKHPSTAIPIKKFLEDVFIEGLKDNFDY